MKFREVNEKKNEELEVLETRLRQELSDLGMKARLGQLRETTKPGAIRRDIARIMTVRRMRVKETSDPALPRRERGGLGAIGGPA